MTEEESVILEKLKSGKYDGFRLDYPSYGKLNRGGRTSRYCYIKDGVPTVATERETKTFDNRENVYDSNIVTDCADSDEDMLAFVQKLGYKMYDHPEARKYSKDFYDERDRLAKERVKEMKESHKQIGVADIQENTNTTEDTPDYNDTDKEVSYEGSDRDGNDYADVIAKIFLFAAAAYGTYKVGKKVYPKAKKWWFETASPAIKGKWDQITNKKTKAESLTETCEQEAKVKKNNEQVKREEEYNV